MPLIDLKTDLKSLKFGKDRPGGGSSNQPYIKSDIPGGDASNLGTTGGPDVLLRGGLLAPVSAINDVSRLTQMFFDLKTPSGPLFIAKENVLSRTSVKTEASFGVGYGGGAVNQGIYTPLSTIGQAAVGFIGGHLNTFGVDPTGLTAFGLNKYEDVVKVNNNTPNSEFNRLVFSTNEKVNQKYNGSISTYSGGPGSVLGIGDTNIRFADQRTGVNNPNYLGNSTPNQTLTKFNVVASSGSSYEYGTLTGVNLFPDSNWNVETGQKLWDNTIYNTGNTFPETNYSLFTQYTNVYQQGQFILNTERNTTNAVQDFRTELISEQNTNSFVMSLAPDYKTKNIENRVNLGNPGTRKNKLRYSTSIDALDKITSLPLYNDDNVTEKSVKNDLVKFRIAVLDNTNSTYKTFIHFRAFIDSFTDNYNADWSPKQYVGRGDKFYNYQGFDRSINMGWTVAAQSKAELIPMYKKLNYLASTLAPKYSSGGFMQGNLVRLTVGGYIYEQLGVITSLTYDVPQESPWEIAINESGDPDNTVKELPHVIKVTGFNFIPIQDFVPQKQNLDFNGDEITYGSQRFISLANGSGPSNNNYDS